MQQVKSRAFLLLLSPCALQHAGDAVGDYAEAPNDSDGTSVSMASAVVMLASVLKSGSAAF